MMHFILVKVSAMKVCFKNTFDDYLVNKKLLLFISGHSTNLTLDNNKSPVYTTTKATQDEPGFNLGRGNPHRPL